LQIYFCPKKKLKGWCYHRDNQICCEGAIKILDSIKGMKELVFLFMHFNKIKLRGITHYSSIKGETEENSDPKRSKYWPRLQSSWLRYKSENKNRLKEVVNLVRSTLAFSKAPGSAATSTKPKKPVQSLKEDCYKPPGKEDCYKPPSEVECYSGC
jgi:hypothetical protein